jgi:hypothetical protein
MPVGDSLNVVVTPTTDRIAMAEMRTAATVERERVRLLLERLHEAARQMQATPTTTAPFTVAVQDQGGRR